MNKNSIFSPINYLVALNTLRTTCALLCSLNSSCILWEHLHLPLPLVFVSRHSGKGCELHNRKQIGYVCIGKMQKKVAEMTQQYLKDLLYIKFGIVVFNIITSKQ